MKCNKFIVSGSNTINSIVWGLRDTLQMLSCFATDPDSQMHM